MAEQAVFLMLKPSLGLLGLALLALFWADLEITTAQPWSELARLFAGAATPEIDWQAGLLQGVCNTLSFALVGTALGVFCGAGLAFFYRWRLVRIFAAVLRSVHELFWAFLLLPVFGLNAVTGILAIALPFCGVFAKVYAEMLEEADHQALQALPPGTGAIERFAFGLLPQLWTELKHYTSYRFECALRSSAVLGFIGLPTLGYHLETWFREGDYSKAFFLVYLFYLIIASLKLWAKPNWVVLWVAVAVWALPKESDFSWVNLQRLITVEIVPWPIRQGEGLAGLASWLERLWVQQAMTGVWETLLVAQVALAGSALLGLLLFPLTSRSFSGPTTRATGHLGLVVLRSTPEYLLAYVFVLLLGPSMAPAILALMLHNGGILAHLAAKRADQTPLLVGVSRRKANRYLYEVLPRLYGQYFAFLLYRWETIIRETAILGLLGLHTLGFYIDSAFGFQRTDEALVLISVAALLNLAVDGFGRKLRGQAGRLA